MPRRILLADESEAVASALRKLGPAHEIDAVDPAGAAARAGASRYDAAIVRGTAGAKVLGAVRAADPLLPVIALFLDRREAAAHPRATADAVLVGPLRPSTLRAVTRLAAELRARGERIAELEARLARAAGPARELEFLKRLLLTEVKRSRRYGYPIALALLAVDPAVPRLAARSRSAVVAEVLGLVSGALREIDVAVPFSEERLLVLMPHTTADGALRVARRLCALVRDRSRTPRLTASAGVATHGGDGTVAFGALVRRASDALGRARAAGGDRAEAADPPKRRDRISIG